MEIIALLLALGIVVLTVLWFYRPVAEPQKLENVGIVKQPPASLGKNQKNVKHLKVVRHIVCNVSHWHVEAQRIVLFPSILTEAGNYA